MRHRFIGGALFAAAALLAGAATGRAQVPGGWAPPGHTYPVNARAQAPADTGGLGDFPLNNHPTIPIPTGASGSAGFYTSAEFVILNQTRTLGEQTVAYRGIVDSTGEITRIPGTYLGSGREALNTRELGRSTYQPGFQVELGYRFEDGTRIYANYMQLFDAHYSAGATLVPPFFRSDTRLHDTFLVAGVFNFPPDYSGPRVDTQYDTGTGNPGFHTYGIWNGADVMDIKFTQRYQQAEIGARVPMFQTEYSRVYGLAGGKFAWFFERFHWRTVDYDIDGIANPQDVAWYTNTLSQRMYGPFVGCGHEIFLHNQFSLSLDLTAGLLLSVVKERVKYRTDAEDPAKRGWNEYDVVPNANANLNLWWYPIEGVQVRVGYNALTYFNTKRMLDPIGFNYGAIDPVYQTQVFRLLHGFNVGIGLFF